MNFIYKSNAEIDEYGFVLFEIEGDEQLFSFRAGICEMVLPTFFADLTAMLKGEIHSFEVDGNEAMTHYQFKRNGSKLRIEMKHWHIREVYEFSLHNFCKSLQLALLYKKGKITKQQQRRQTNLEN